MNHVVFRLRHASAKPLCAFWSAALLVLVLAHRNEALAATLSFAVVVVSVLYELVVTVGVGLWCWHFAKQSGITTGEVVDALVTRQEQWWERFRPLDRATWSARPEREAFYLDLGYVREQVRRAAIALNEQSQGIDAHAWTTYWASEDAETTSE